MVERRRRLARSLQNIWILRSSRHRWALAESYETATGLTIVPKARCLGSMSIYRYGMLKMKTYSASMPEANLVDPSLPNQIDFDLRFKAGL